MRKKTTIMLVLIVCITVFLIGCSPDEIADLGDEEQIDINEDVDYTEGEIAPPPVNRDLREQLLGATVIELKDTDNRIMGVLQSREAIASFVEQLFEYDKREEYTPGEQARVIGPMNFYFDDDEDIFGLMNEGYIYIEGSYFLIDNRKANNIKGMFEENTTTAPAGT